LDYEKERYGEKIVSSIKFLEIGTRFGSGMNHGLKPLKLKLAHRLQIKLKRIIFKIQNLK